MINFVYGCLKTKGGSTSPQAQITPKHISQNQKLFLDGVLCVDGTQMCNIHVTTTEQQQNVAQNNLS